MANGDTFSSYLDDITLKGTLSMAIGLGSSLGIFEVMTDIGPKTYVEIAKAGGWNSTKCCLWRFVFSSLRVQQSQVEVM